MANVTTTTWVPEPDGRGTFGILRSCIITLSLCVYSALHLNIFPKGATGLQNLLSKTKWIVIGMFCPEIVVFVAFQQLQTARTLTKELDKIFEQQTADKAGAKRRHIWTTTHSFYALMGGFAFDTNDPGEPPYISKSPRLYLHPNAIGHVAQLGFLPDISIEHIRDKSKTDRLGKSIAIIQATWMIVQCIMRAAFRLPVTCLELNTLSHAACALIIYALWWNKPMNVQDSTILTGEWTRQICAFMWMSSPISSRKRKGFFNSIDTRRAAPEIESLRRVDTEDAIFGPGYSEVYNSSSNTMVHRPTLSTNANAPGSITINLRQNEVILPIGLGPGKSFFLPDNTRFRRTPGPAQLEVDSITLARWANFSQALKEYPDMTQKILGDSKYNDIDLSQPEWLPHETNLGTYQYSVKFPPYVLEKPRNSELPSSLSKEVGALTQVLVFVVCATLYGGIHAAAWNEYFPSSIEALLWRISSIYVASTGLAFAIHVFIHNPLGSWLQHMYDLYGEEGIFSDHLFRVLLYYLVRGRYWKPYFDLISSFMFVTMIAFYIFARGYLVIEAFISLRILPIQAYETPDWTQYLPHF